jgi:hypothetical protein
VKDQSPLEWTNEDETFLAAEDEASVFILSSAWPFPRVEHFRILAAARELFAARGFKGTTTAAIARRARANEALIFRHFPGKKGLFTAILREKLEDDQSDPVFILTVRGVGYAFAER